MDGLRVGPLFLSSHGLAILLGIAVALVAARLLDRRRALALGNSLTNMGLAGLLAGRLAWVALHPEDYGSPLDILVVRDGGFELAAAFFAALLAGAWSTRGLRAARIPLAASATAGIVAWSLAFMAVEAEFARTPIPDIVVRRLDGTPQRLADFKGKPLFINLWATWCPYCRREMADLMAAQRANPDLTFLLINQGETQQEVETFLRKEGLPGTAVLMDPGSLALDGWNARGLPTTLIYDSSGTLLDRTSGTLSRTAIAQRVEAIRPPR